MTKPDCIADCFEPEVFDAANRHFTVGYASRYPDYTRLPALTIKGQWLEAAGFGTGTKVDAKVMQGCIVLTAREEVSEFEMAVREACRLSKRKQKQVVDFIGVIAGKSGKG